MTDEIVGCPQFRCLLRLGACLRRHVDVWASGRRKGHPKFPPCARCGLARLRLARAPWFVAPPPWDAPVILEPAQQRARLRWTCSFPSYSEPEAGPLDALHEAALLAPDDRGISIDVG